MESHQTAAVVPVVCWWRATDARSGAIVARIARLTERRSFPVPATAVVRPGLKSVRHCVHPFGLVTNFGFPNSATMSGLGQFARVPSEEVRRCGAPGASLQEPSRDVRLAQEFGGRRGSPRSASPWVGRANRPAKVLALFALAMIANGGMAVYARRSFRLASGACAHGALGVFRRSRLLGEGSTHGAARRPLRTLSKVVVGRSTHRQRRPHTALGA